jgi:Domain of unknown function (DUF5130)
VVSGELIRPDSSEPDAEEVAAIEALDAARGVGPTDMASVPAAFSPRQLSRLDEALTMAAKETGLLFSVYVGALGGGRPAAEKLMRRLDAPAGGAVLLAVSPGERELHIVTTAATARRLPNRVCELAALGMRAAFSGGDLTGGLVTGLRMLADAAGSPSNAFRVQPGPAARRRGLR